MRPTTGDSGPGADGLRVVVVDDSEPIRSLLITLLTGASCTVAGVASDGEEAIAVVCAQQPDLVVLDLHMPGCDGLEVLRRLRPACPATRFVMFTSGDADGIAACLAAGAERHFPKQDIAELMDYISALCA